MKSAPIAAVYTSFLTEVKGLILTARFQAGRAVNRELVMLYWDIGRGIVERQRTAGWGDAVVERPAADLRAEFPDMRGFSGRNVWDMKRLSLACSEPEFPQQAVAEMGRAEIPQQHKTVQARVLGFAHEIGWSRVSRTEAE